MDNLPNLSFISAINDRVYAVLKNAILRKMLPPGHKLNVSSLAAKWGVSNSPINDAMQRLMIEGLVEVVSRKGTFVAEVRADDLLEQLVVRQMFETTAAELSVAAVSDDDLDSWRRLLEESDKLFAGRDFDYFTYVGFDADFHSRPLIWAGNQQLLKIFQFQNFHWNTARAFYGRLPSKPHQRQCEHWDLYRAYQSRSLPAIREAIARHIDGSRQDINDALCRGELQR